MVQTRLVEMQPIHKGWSKDKKYYVLDERGQAYLLRVSDLDMLEARQANIAFLQEAQKMKLPLPIPVELDCNGQEVHLLLQWIDGEDLSSALARLTPDEIYRHGLEMGHTLQRLHHLAIDQTRLDWSSFYQKKIDAKLKAYKACPEPYEDGQVLVDFVEQHRHLLEGRPIAHQHGDFHIGNMLLGKDNRVYLIDVDRQDVGDPWEEFNRIFFTVEVSPLLASAMLDGYFEGNIPSDFWQLLALYVATNCLASLPWAYQVDPLQVPVMREQAKAILSCYRRMQVTVPSWYQGFSENDK